MDLREKCAKRFFFLGTLCFSSKNDNIITKTFKKLDAGASITLDGRGKHIKRFTDEESIRDFAEAHHAVISHYSREKTPKKRYLPCDVTIKGMYTEYVSRYGPQLAYNTFYKIFKGMNISMRSLGNEECETCAKHKKHKEICSCADICDVSEYMKHKAKYRAARAEYKNDAEENTNRPYDTKVSADLETVIMLPKMDQYKACVFAHRLIVFNETFSELGKKGKDTAVLWHCGVSGRRDENIASAFHRYFADQRDTKKLTLWLDNCSGHNKNWTLYTLFLFMVNSPDYSVEEIHLKYFEPGHTFMASDSAHGRIESKMRQKRKIFDFKDFVTVVKDAGCEAVEMDYTDFRYWKSGASQYALKQLGDKRPYLSQVVSARFSTGSEEISYQTSFVGPVTNVEILKNTYKLSDCCGEQMKQPRGLPPCKKTEIIDNLLPLMPENRCSFRRNLREDRKSLDLINY